MKPKVEFSMAGLLSMALAATTVAQTGVRSAITNDAGWENGWAKTLPGASRPNAETAFVYRPETEWTYSHHPFISFFRGRFYAIWSNGRQDQDAAGQRVLMSTSADFSHWEPPHPLIDSRSERILTAGGLHVHNNELVAFFGSQEAGVEASWMEAVIMRDGQPWRSVPDMALPVASNHGPFPLASGRLLICSSGPWFSYTDDPRGITGWRTGGLYPQSTAGSSGERKAIAQQKKWPSVLGEPSFFQTDDGVVQMLMRNPGARRLWLTQSHDNGETWSPPVETEFSNSVSKFHFGRLPDGRFYYVGNPLGMPGPRTPLILSISRDGIRFNRHFVLGDSHFEIRRAGQGKYGEYAYPHSIVQDGHVYVIVSRQKEAIEVLRISLRDLSEN
ncbi:MAG: exo-alpha-sialidase [Opitutaceae bacterium]|nr:exo-alpha-sialidase [Opitutaceae bacterium]